MRVLHVVPFYYPAVLFGGPVYSTKAICDEVSRHTDCEVVVVTTRAKSPYNDEEFSEEDLAGIRTDQYSVHYADSVRGAMSAFRFLKLVADEIKLADVVHVSMTYSFPTIPVLVLARIYSKPCIWSTRGGVQATYEWPEVPKRNIKRAFELVASSVAPSILYLHGTSLVEKSVNAERLNCLESVCIPNGVDVRNCTTSKSERIVADSGFRLLFLSRIHRKKGIEVLIHSLKHLPDDVFLDVWGTGEDGYVKELECLASDLEVSNRVRFCGHCADHQKADVFGRCDLFVLPSHSENFGIVIAESLAFGVPVVTSVEDPWRLVEEKQCGYFVAPSQECVADAVIKARSADLDTMGENGRRWINESFSNSALGLEFVNLYRKACAGEMFPNVDI